MSLFYVAVACQAQYIAFATSVAQEVFLRYDSPKSLSEVTIHYTIELEDGTVVKDTTSGEPAHMVIDDADILPGFDELVKAMRLQEKCEYTV